MIVSIFPTKHYRSVFIKSHSLSAFTSSHCLSVFISKHSLLQSSPAITLASQFLGVELRFLRPSSHASAPSSLSIHSSQLLLLSRSSSYHDPHLPRPSTYHAPPSPSTPHCTLRYTSLTHPCICRCSSCREPAYRGRAKHLYGIQLASLTDRYVSFAFHRCGDGKS